MCLRPRWRPISAVAKQHLIGNLAEVAILAGPALPVLHDQPVRLFPCPPWEAVDHGAGDGEVRVCVEVGTWAEVAASSAVGALARDSVDKTEGLKQSAEAARSKALIRGRRRVSTARVAAHGKSDVVAWHAMGRGNWRPTDVSPEAADAEQLQGGGEQARWDHDLGRTWRWSRLGVGVSLATTWGRPGRCHDKGVGLALVAEHLACRDIILREDCHRRQPLVISYYVVQVDSHLAALVRDVVDSVGRIASLVFNAPNGVVRKDTRQPFLALSADHALSAAPYGRHKLQRSVSYHSAASQGATVVPVMRPVGVWWESSHIERDVVRPTAAEPVQVTAGKP